MAAISTLVDNFDASSRDAAKWNEDRTNDLSSLVTISQNGTLNIACTPNNATLQYAGYVSATTYDLTNSAAFCECVQTFTSVTNGDSEIALFIDASNDYTAYVTGGFLKFQRQASAVKTGLYSGTYDATAHRWMRIRHGSSLVYFETSPDGTTWTAQVSESPAIAITALYLKLTAGTYAGSQTPPTAQFDNFNPWLTNSAIGTWVTTGSTSGAAAISELVTPSDAEYITSPMVGAAASPSKFALTASKAAGSYTFQVRSSASYGGTLLVRFLDASNASVGSATQALTSTLMTYSLSVTLSGTATQVQFEVTNP